MADNIELVEEDGESVDQKKGNGKSDDIKKDLSKELQVVYDALTPESIIFFNGLKSGKKRKDYLRTILAEKKSQRKKGALVVNLFASAVVLIVVVSLIMVIKEEKDESKSKLYTIISYIMTFSVQSIAIALGLYCEKGLNKGFFICTFYASLPLFVAGLGFGLMEHYHIETISALSLFGLGVVFANWIKDLLAKMNY